MVEVAPAPASAASKKTKKAAAKKPAVAEKTRTYPPASEMVVAAITALNEKKGSSLQAIKKYIAEHYLCDVDKQAIFIRKFIKSAVEKNILVRTKGTGASGSFKLAKPEKPEKKPKASAEKPAEKPEKSKKSAAPGTSKAKKPNSPVKKTGKSPTAKPKAPKAKKATSKSAEK